MTGDLSTKLIALFLVLLCQSLLVINADSPAVNLSDLKSQIKALGDQIKEAEAGRLNAEKLLEDGKSRQKSFAGEIESLKASIDDRDTRESTLQKQLVLLQEEAKNLRGEELLHKELKDRFEAVSSELEATKNTLANTLKQLADKSSSASAAESKVAEAQRDLEKAQKQRNEANEKLGELKSNAEDTSKLQKQLDKERDKSAKLEADMVSLTGEAMNLKAEVSDLKSELKAAQKELSSWQRKVDKAERAVQSAEKQLEKAMQEHSSTQSALLQAEAKAEEAMKKLETLLTSWLPHWLEQRYHQLLKAVEPTVKRVQPALNSAWKQGQSLSKDGKSRALWAYGAAKTRILTAWTSASPTFNKALTDSKKHLSTLSEHVGKVSEPHVHGLKLQAHKAYKTSQKYVVEGLSHPQVLKVRRQLLMAIRNLENLAIKYLRQVPALKQYAKQPFVTYLVYAALSAPIIAVLVPLLALRGERRKPVQYETSRISQRDDSPAAQPSKGHHKAKKARRITVGEEAIRVP